MASLLASSSYFSVLTSLLCGFSYLGSMFVCLVWAYIYFFRPKMRRSLRGSLFASSYLPKRVRSECSEFCLHFPRNFRFSNSLKVSAFHFLQYCPHVFLPQILDYFSLLRLVSYFLFCDLFCCLLLWTISCFCCFNSSFSRTFFCGWFLTHVYSFVPFDLFFRFLSCLPFFRSSVTFHFCLISCIM